MNTSVRLIQLPQFADARGVLTVGDQNLLPFPPARFFIIGNVVPGAARGGHAHKRCHQLVIVSRGACKLTLIDDGGRDEITVSSPAVAVHIPPLVWAELTDFTPDASVVVMASEGYDADDYIRSLDEATRRPVPE